jgi:Tol biopolymer transport system component
MVSLGGERGAERALTTGFGNWVGGGGVCWLNEREVLFSAIVDGMNTFMAVDVNGGAPRRLIHNIPMWNVAASPDGSQITFVSNKSGSNQIWIADASGANARQVTKAGSVGKPSFTADGKSIVYVTADETQYAWRVPVDGSKEPERITDVPTNRAQFSPDGRWLLLRLRSKEPNVPLWRTAVRAAAGGPLRYFDSPRYGGRPVTQWHPAGGAFVYVDNKDGVGNIWMQKVDGSAPEQVTFFTTGDIFAFDIARDGKRLVVARGETTSDAVLIRNFR